MTGRKAGRRATVFAALLLGAAAGDSVQAGVGWSQTAASLPAPVTRYSSRISGGAFEGEFHLKRSRTPEGRYSSRVDVTTPRGVEGVVAVQWDAGADELLVVLVECSTGWYAAFGRSSGIRLPFEDFGWGGISRMTVERTLRMTEQDNVILDGVVVAGMGEGLRRWAFSQQSYAENQRSALGALRGAFSATRAGEALDEGVVEFVSFLYTARETLPSNPVADVGEILEELLFPVLEPEFRGLGLLEEYSIPWQRDKLPARPEDSGAGSTECRVPALEGWIRSLRSR
jgi:hypothetical protein